MTRRTKIALGAGAALALLIGLTWTYRVQIALLFAAWLVKVIPGIRMIHAAFQNIRPDEEPVVA